MESSRFGDCHSSVDDNESVFSKGYSVDFSTIMMGRQPSFSSHNYNASNKNDNANIKDGPLFREKSTDSDNVWRESPKNNPPGTDDESSYGDIAGIEMKNRERAPEETVASILPNPRKKMPQKENSFMNRYMNVLENDGTPSGSDNYTITDDDESLTVSKKDFSRGIYTLIWEWWGAVPRMTMTGYRHRHDRSPVVA